MVKVRPSLQRSTVGWFICIQWKDGSASWEKLSDIKECYPVETEEYTVAQGINHEPAYNIGGLDMCCVKDIASSWLWSRGIINISNTHIHLVFKWQRPFVRDLDYTRLMIQGSTTNHLSWKGNIDYRKSALDYTTLGRAFRNRFSFQNVFRVFINTMILKTISSWKPLSREFTYKVISTANILHIFLSLLGLSVHSHSLILRYCIIPDYIHHPMICLRRYSNCGLANGFVMNNK